MDIRMDVEPLIFLPFFNVGVVNRNKMFGENVFFSSSTKYLHQMAAKIKVFPSSHILHTSQPEPRSTGPSPRGGDYPLPCLSGAGRGSRHGASQPARACPYCHPGPSLPLGTAGSPALNRRPIYPPQHPQRQNDFSRCCVDSLSLMR